MTTTHTQNIYESKLKQLFESTQPNERMVMMQQATSPLKRIENSKILESIIDPTTGQPYEGGIICEGEFASIDVLNNNNRFYSESNYLDFVDILKHQALSPKGLYGELEHPKSYAVDYNNISHKVLDIWYDKSTKKVFGVILILNTPKGLIAQQVIKSGGQIAISARGGGAEVKNPDGTITAVLKLLTTFDIVCHPGFSSSILGFVDVNSLNESICIKEENMVQLAELYESFKILAPKQSFMGWLNDTDNNKVDILFESTSSQESIQKQQADQQVLQKGQSADEQQIEDDMEDAVDEELSESEIKQQEFFQQTIQARKQKQRKLRGAYYDGSAGFLSPDNSSIGTE